MEIIEYIFILKLRGRFTRLFKNSNLVVEKDEKVWMKFQFIYLLICTFEPRMPCGLGKNKKVSAVFMGWKDQNPFRVSLVRGNRREYIPSKLLGSLKNYWPAFI